MLAHVPSFGRNPRGSPDFLAYPVPKACMHVLGTRVPRRLGVARSALSPKAALALGRTGGGGEGRGRGGGGGGRRARGGAGAKGSGRARGGPVQCRGCEGGRGCEEEGVEESEGVGNRRHPRGVGG